MAARYLTSYERAERRRRRLVFPLALGIVIAGFMLANSCGVWRDVGPRRSAAPDESTFEGGIGADHNRAFYGHAAPQTAQEQAADASWQAVKDAEGELIGEGGDYRAYNRRLTAAYRRWEVLEEAAYGSRWRSLWRTRHVGDVLGECGSLQKLGMTHSECVASQMRKGDIEPLEPKLMKCSPGGMVIPRDEVSCRTRGRENEYSRRGDAIANDEAVTYPE